MGLVLFGCTCELDCVLVCLVWFVFGVIWFDCFGIGVGFFAVVLVLLYVFCFPCAVWYLQVGVLINVCP